MGKTASESGRSSTEFQASCGESAANKPASVAAVIEKNSATSRKMITAAAASKAICTNCTAVSDLPNPEWLKAIKIGYPGGWLRLFKSASDDDELKNPRRPSRSKSSAMR